MRDAGESPLAGVEFSVQQGGIIVASHFTGESDEAHCFEGLEPGEYRVTAEAPDDYQETNPTSLTVALNPGRRVPIALGFAPIPDLPQGQVIVGDGRRAQAIYASRPPAPTFYLRTLGALYRTTNSGANWARVAERPPSDHIVVSASDPDQLLAGDGFPCFRGGPDAPLYRSMDGGMTWNEMPGGLNLRPTAIHPDDPRIAWAVGCEGAYQTEDGGENWSLQPADAWGIFTLETILPVPGNPQVVFAAGNSEGGSGAVFRSNDGGRTWQTIQEGLELWVSALLPHRDDPDQVWFATPNGVWRTDDGGRSWEQSARGLEEVTVGQGYAFEGVGLHALAQDAAGILYLGTEQGLYQSRDGGASWERFGEGPGVEGPVSGVITGPGGKRLWLETVDGVWALAP
jgi:photosystem II stability/assembly factor-like uncharacterized protein